MFCALVSRVVNTSNRSKYGCCYTKMDDDYNNNSHATKHEEHSTRCGCQFVFVSSQDYITSEIFDIGETLFFTNNGWSGLVNVKSFSLDKTNVLRIIVTNSNGDDIITTKEHLRSPNNPNVGWIPISFPEYKQSSKTLSEKDIEKITSPKHLLPLQQEFLSVHYKLNHLPFTIILRPSNMSILPRRFLKLRNDLPPCVSYLFGQAHCRPWRHKSSTTSTDCVLRSADITKPGQRVGTDQIVSAQPGLFPQEKGQMTRARIWGATVFCRLCFTLGKGTPHARCNG